MNTRQAYDLWSNQYDSNINKTRDLEKIALRATLADLQFKKVLEIGCGTGKNTEWLVTRSQKVTAVDLSDEMLYKARKKISSPTVQFQQADITKEWAFGKEVYDLVSFSLVLEHIEDLDPVLAEASASLKSGGYVYIGELHPFKQYSGSKARFDTEEGRHIVECFNHHISDFIKAGKTHGLMLLDVNEYFDNDDRTAIPRILTLLFRKL